MRAVQIVVTDSRVHAARVVAVRNQTAGVIFNLPGPRTARVPRIAEVVTGVGVLLAGVHFK